MAISKLTGRGARLGAGAALLAGGALAGLVLAGASTASAADESGTGMAGAAAGASCTSGQRPEHKALSEADAAKVKAAALEAVPGGTVTRTEAGPGDTAYHAHVTKADGSKVRVSLDKDFHVTGTAEDNGGPGGGRGGGRGGGPGARPGADKAGADKAGQAGQAGTASAPGGGPGGHGRHGPGGGGGPGGDCGPGQHAPLSDADAAKVKAAALEAVPGGTVTRAEAGHGDAAYEAHVTKADGSKVRVSLDKDFKVTGTEEDKGGPGRRPHGGAGRGEKGAQPAAPATSAS